MRRGTTPTYLLRFSDGVGAEIADIVLTFKQAYVADLVLSLSDSQIALNGDTASCTLTQAQTLGFRRGKLTRQVKIKFLDGNVQTTDLVEEVVAEDQHGRAI